MIYRIKYYHRIKYYQMHIDDEQKAYMSFYTVNNIIRFSYRMFWTVRAPKIRIHIADYLRSQS